MSEWPIPKPIDPINAEFWKVCQDGILRFQRCTKCDRFRHLPRYMCAICSSTDYEWSAVEPRGSLYSWTVTHQVFHTKFAVPFIAAVVEFSEGVRLMSQLVDTNADQLKLGLPIDVEFYVVSDEFQTPIFKLAV